jgi:hypothetical protein
VLLSKQVGGFAVRDLRRQNLCLLMHFIDKLHRPEPLPWKEWFRRQVPGDLGDAPPTSSFIAKIVHEGLATFRALTKVRVGDGKFTSFWHDKWHQLGVLSLEFEALFSHCTRQNASVHSVVRNGSRSVLVSAPPLL